MTSRRKINIHWTKRLSCQIALAFLCGILLYQTGSRWWLLAAGCVAVVLFVPLIGQKKYRECALRGGLLLAVWLLGAGCQIREERIWQTETQRLFREPRISVCGTLIRKEKQAKGWQLTLALPDYENRVIVSTQDGGYPLDCVLSVEGSVREFDIPRNEGQFNQRQYYKCRRILGRISDPTIRCIQVQGGIYAWREQLFSLRTQMCGVYESCLPSQAAGMLAAMVTGEKSGMDAEVRRLFQVAGFSHILAISGMHISLIGMGIYRLLRKSRRSYGCCGAVTAGCLLLYGELIGWGVSSRRAIGMFGIYLLAQYLGRSYDLWSSLSLSAVLLLADQPFLFGDAGFRLSFAAVMAVAVAKDVLPDSSDVYTDVREDVHLDDDADGRHGGRHRPIPLRPLGMALLIQLFTLPLVAYSYYELPVYALFLNLLLLPYAGLIVGCGLVGGLAGIRWLEAARILLLPCRIVASVYVWMCGRIDLLPHASMICGQPTMEKLVLYYLLLITALWLGQKLCKKRYKKQYRTAAWLPVMAIGLIALLFAPERGQSGFEIDYLDVGQGDGAMIKTASGTVCFVDGGSTDVTGVGTYRILPFLKSKGIKAVDYWIISHADEDHVNGFYEVLGSGYEVRTVVIAACMPESPAKGKLLQAAADSGVPVLQVQAGQTLYPDRVSRSAKQGDTADARLHILAPAQMNSDSNAASLVCLYEDASVRALFTGDIGAEQERELLERRLAVPVDLYKAAHHGSRYSNSGAFLSALAPKLSVVSCARRNRYGHPAQQAIENMRASGSRIRYTMYSGQIKVRLSQGGLTVYEYVSGDGSEHVSDET